VIPETRREHEVRYLRFYHKGIIKHFQTKENTGIFSRL